MIFRSLWAPALLAALAGSAPQEPAAPVDPPIQVPPGFTCERVAGPPLVDRPMMAGFDDRGRLFVCESSGFNLMKGTSEILVKDPPHSIRMLEDTDGDGRFDKSTLFADRMTFPMGALWHDGALYVASAPSYWRLEDTDGDGKADRRREIVTRFDFGGNACDVHGPFLGPDGRLYWANCNRGYALGRPDGTVLKGKTAGVFRSRADGSDIELVCGGGMDNPVEIAFTDEGEAFATVNLLHGNPRMDAIIHCVEGGNFPKSPGSRELKRTGDLLPPMTDLGWVAPAGLMRCRSGALGPEFRGNLFSAHFNTHKVQRHVVERDGATFRSRNQDFLVSTHPDFHATDVLEDADGSLLVVDTGGWFLRGCPTSRVEKLEVKGAIYRIRRKGMAPVADPRGLRIPWDRLAPQELAALLDDPRFAVRDRAIDGLARRGPDAVATLAEAARKASSPEARRNAVWALTRIEGQAARAAARPALEDKDPGVRIAASHSAALHRDGASRTLLEGLLREEIPSIRRAAATALGRIGDRKSVPGLLEGLSGGGDRFLEHALIYALIEIGDAGGTRKGLSAESAHARRGALIALDQMEGGNLARTEVTPHLDPANPALLGAALGILTARPEWAGETMGLLKEWLGREEPPGELAGVLTAFARDGSVQDLVARTLRGPKASGALRLVLLEAMAQAPLDRLPATWLAEARWSLESADERIVRQAVATLRGAGAADFDDAFLRIARDEKRSGELRVEALGAAAARIGRLEPALFSLLVSSLNKEKPVLLRMAAAQALGSSGLDDAQLGALAAEVAQAGALELPKLLGAYERSRNAQTGKRLLAALEKCSAVESLSPEGLRRTLAHYPEEVKKQAEGLLKRLDVDADRMKARLSELEPALSGGDPARGREVFFGKKAACTACHAVQNQGGRVGPDLSKIGQIRAGRDLLESIVFPSASFVRGYEPTLIRTKSGAVYDGLIARETADAIHLVRADRTEQRVPRASVEAIQQSRISIMPQGLDAQLSRDELRDLLAYLLSLK
jgi:putative membrane-bound dehydrogenase-like protein